MGAHYTPPALARLLAEKIIEHLEPPAARPIRVLDPACGAGGLLRAAMDALRRRGFEKCRVVGVEADRSALRAASSALNDAEDGRVELIAADFLDVAASLEPQRDLWLNDAARGGLCGDFDVVIANPPYVRTQVLGAGRAQQLANRFDLSGRVDLYHAFIRAMTHALGIGGVLGVITSNRFMSTLAGKAVRVFLSNNLELLELIDLGDTKLFEAAVLPAVLIGRRRDSGRSSRPYLVPFTRVYSQEHAAPAPGNVPPERDTIVEALAAGDKGLLQVPEGTFDITRGRFCVTPGSSDVWALLSSQQSELVARLRNSSRRTIQDVAHVRVGIKTTADDVFIREDWARVPSEKRPEDELLRPLLRHQDASRWAMPSQHAPAARVLYPHFVSGGRKQVVNLDRYPGSRAYLEDHRSRLEARRYVVEAGREWYEVWVPQDPGAWASPKIVFPDISPDPRFFLVDGSYVVNGDCYWMTLRPGVGQEMLYLILGVANSSLMTRFHDAAFSNKLYSGRRRYITQYVSKYPLPDANTEVARRIVSVAAELVKAARAKATHEVRQHERTMDILVRQAFGLDPQGGPA